MTYRVVFSPEAEAQLLGLYRYIAGQASHEIAGKFTDAIVIRCEALDTFPDRGTPHDKLRPGLRTLAFRRRVTIAYAVDPGEVTILGIFYGGQNFEDLLQES